MYKRQDKEIVPVVEKVTGDNNVQTQKVAGTNQVIIKTVTLDLDTVSYTHLSVNVWNVPL